jgi:hypothetical protein
MFMGQYNMFKLSKPWNSWTLRSTIQTRQGKTCKFLVYNNFYLFLAQVVNNFFNLKKNKIYAEIIHVLIVCNMYLKFKPMCL